MGGGARGTGSWGEGLEGQAVRWAMGIGSWEGARGTGSWREGLEGQVVGGRG